MRKVALLAASVLFAASSLFAQNSNIESLSGLQFNFGNPGARSLGMGGAFLGLADDASAAEANPAGLTILRKPEITVEGRNYKSGQTFNVSGDFPDLTSQTFSSYSRRAEPTFASVVIPFNNFAIAGYYHEPINFQNSLAVISDEPIFYFLGANGPIDRDECIRLGSTGCQAFSLLPFGTAVDVRLQTYGAAFAWKMGHLSLGAAGRYQKLNEAAITIRLDDRGRIGSQTAQLSDEHDITFSGGLKYAPSDRFSLGAVYKKGADFEAPLYANVGNGFAQFANPNFSLPDTYGVGVSFRPVPVLTINADAVRVKYSRLSENIESIVPNITASDFETPDVTELHAGAEYFFSTRIPFAIRAGYWRDPAHSLEFVGPLNRGNAIAERVLFPGGKDQNHISGGIGLAWPRFQIDAAYDTSDNNKVGSLSVVTRF